MAYLTSGKKKLLGSNTEGKGIDFWQPNTDYKVNDLCLYKEENYYSVYICVTEHTSADAFVSAYWETIDGTEFEGYTEDEILAMLNLSEEELQNLQNLLQDNVISTTSTFSSSKIYAELLTLREELDKVFQNVDNGKDLIASAITDKGINTSKDDTFETMANNINSINVSGDLDSIHTAMIDLGYSYTNLDGIDSDETAHIIGKWFVLKTATDSVDTILDVANTDTFTDWVTDDEITDFGDYINPTYSATQLTVSEDSDSGLFVSEEIAVHELYTINEGEVD